MIGKRATNIEEDIVVCLAPARCWSMTTGVGTLLKEDHVDVGEEVAKVDLVVGRGTTRTKRPHSPRAFMGVAYHVAWLSGLR